MAKKQRKIEVKREPDGESAEAPKDAKADAAGIEKVNAESSGKAGVPESKKTETAKSKKPDAAVKKKTGETGSKKPETAESKKPDVPKSKKAEALKSKKADISGSKKAGASESEEPDAPSGKKRVRNVLLAILSAAVLVTATVLIVLYILGDNEPIVQIVRERPARPTGVQGTVVTWDNLDDVREAMARPPQDASYTASLSLEWTFERWDIPARDLYVENSTFNTRTVFFDVFLGDTDILIYESPYLHVGESVENFALDAEVQPGSYTATVVYYLVDDDYEVITYVPVVVGLNILG